jgi:hypothetical protein
MRLAPPPRCTVAPGVTLDLCVLAAGAPELVGVDLASGAFVRCPRIGGPWRPFDVVRIRLAAGEPLWSPHAPESVEPDTTPPQRVGRLAGRRAERLLRPLLDPPGDHLLGFAGPAVPFWTLAGDRPSLALVTPEGGPAVRTAGPGQRGYRCVFRWRGRDHVLPLADLRLARLLDDRGQWRAAGAALASLLGFRPTRVVVGLGPPRGGHCYKVAFGLLPGR